MSTKNTKISWAWCHALIVPATRDAEVGESLEPRKMEVAVSQNHATTFQPERPCLKKKKEALNIFKAVYIIKIHFIDISNLYYK